MASSKKSTKREKRKPDDELVAELRSLIARQARDASADRIGRLGGAELDMRRRERLAVGDTGELARAREKEQGRRPRKREHFKGYGRDAEGVLRDEKGAPASPVDPWLSQAPIDVLAMAERLSGLVEMVRRDPAPASAEAVEAVRLAYAAAFGPMSHMWAEVLAEALMFLKALPAKYHAAAKWDPGRIVAEIGAVLPTARSAMSGQPGSRASRTALGLALKPPTYARWVAPWIFEQLSPAAKGSRGKLSLEDAVYLLLRPSELAQRMPDGIDRRRVAAWARANAASDPHTAEGGGQ